MRYSIERAFEGISRAGYSYVSFGMPHEGMEVPDEEDGTTVDKLHELLDKYELTPVMLICNKPFKFDQPIERAYRRLEVAKALGIKEVLTGGITNYKKYPDELLPLQQYEQNKREFVEHYKKIAEKAEELGIVITLKPYTGNTATSREINETIGQIGSPVIHACYDAGNVQFYEGIDAAADFLNIAHKTHSIIAKDHRGTKGNLDFPIPGTGDVDFRSIFNAWSKCTDGNGYVLVERVDGPSDPELIDQRIAESRIQLERLIDHELK
ncbi:sugar phosphate isomerase/epimerase family protein [Paenibacillus oceani]|uniref:TIM barrel protein n=1 Tax=Paenibacillus oceani TaxID=2772510 RepID=A0A927CAK4_9BACL|nr:TIM barrel protein [Paenibacillus oceani]MBD2863187.1 TIM barrel protein [Paenibacillus oceani]